VDEQIATLGPRDLLIRPPLGDLGTADFRRVADGIAIGGLLREARAALATFSVSEAEYERLRPRRERAAPPVIHFVRIENRSRLGDELIRARLTLKEGEPLDSERLREDIGRIYGLDVFETVRYEIVQEDGRTGVVVQATEKSWGPQYLQFGIELTDNFEGSNAYNLGSRCAYRHQPAQRRDPARRAGRTGRDLRRVAPAARRVVALLYERQSLHRAPELLAVQCRWRRHLGLRSARRGGSISRLAANSAPGRGAPRLPVYQRRRRRTRRRSGIRDRRLRAGADLCAASAWTSSTTPISALGQQGQGRVSWARGFRLRDSDFDQLSLRFSQAFSWRRNTLMRRALDTTLDGTAPIESQFRAGGFLQLSGYQPRELNGQHFGELRARTTGCCRHQIAPTYGGFSLEYGNVWQNRSDISLDNGVFAGSMFLGVWSPIGPLYVGVGLAEHGRRSAFLYLGPVF
jgi:NTE family protein